MRGAVALFSDSEAMCNKPLPQARMHFVHAESAPGFHKLCISRMAGRGP